MIERAYGNRFLIYQSDCAEGALEIFQNSRVDLLMSDIRMPGMDGLEMVEIVEKEWPDCLTIFLTGHSEFEYARQAVGSRTIDYVLKLDGDEALRRAIDKAYDRLEKEQEEKSRLLKLNASWQEAAPLLRRECFRRMVTTVRWEETDKAQLYAKLQAAGISFDLQSGFLTALICMEPEWDASVTGQIQSIILGNIKGAFRAGAAYVSEHIMLLLAQSEDNRPLRLKGFLEIALSMCERVELIPPAVYLYEKETGLEGLSEVFSILSSKRFEMEEGGGILLCGKKDALSSYTWRREGPVMGAFNVEKLSDSLVYGKEGDFMAVLAKIKAGMPASGPAAEITIYTTLASLLLQAILNYLPRESSLLTQINLEKLANYNTHHGFRDACYYLETVAEKYFRSRQEIHTDTDNYIVHKVNTYILEHLSEDLSMTRIGEIAGLHPAYLSRLYKKVTDNSLGQYITAQRLNAAKMLLQDPTIRIQSIAERVGLNTASYFTHFFKKSMGMSPQEYRMKLLGQEKDGVSGTDGERT